MKHFTIFILGIIFSFTIFAQVSQTVIVEHFTNTECGICSSRNPALYDLLDDYPEVLHIAYHPSSPYPGCVFSQHNIIENDARTNFYGIFGGTPRVVLNGEVVPLGSQLLTEGQLTPKLGKSADYTIEIEQIQLDNLVEVTIVIKRVNGSASENLTIHAALAEKQINYSAPNGETEHHEVFRKDIVTGSVNLVTTGDSIVFTETYSIHPDWQENQMVVIAILQKANDKILVQAAESGFISNPTGIKTNYQASGLIYPNPANQKISFSHDAISQFNKASFYNVFGKKVFETGLTQSAHVADLPTGYYFLVFENDDKKAVTTKLIISR